MDSSHHSVWPPRHLHPVGSCPAAASELPGDDFVRSQHDLFDHLVPFVGTVDALWHLDTEPLPDEPFDWSAVDDRDRSFVEDVVAKTDQCCDLVLDVEFRTITRRLLALVAARDPRPFRRSPHAGRCAASLVWLACDSSGALGWGRRRSSSWIWAWFGVGNCSDRGRTLRRAAGLEPEQGWFGEPMSLGDPTLLHSSFRAVLVIQRDRSLEHAERRRTWCVVDDAGPTAKIEVRANPTRVVSAVKGVLPDTGRGTVLVGFGDCVEDASYVSLTIPEAHELVRKVQDALDAPLPRMI